jgi:hypothetical protein
MEASGAESGQLKVELEQARAREQELEAEKNALETDLAGGHGSFIEDLCGVVDLYDEGKEDLCSSDRGSETSSSFSYDSGFEID